MLTYQVVLEGINNGRICVAIVARRWVSGEPSHALASMATTLIFRSMLSYMKLLDIPLGLIINFNVLKLPDSVSNTAFPD